MQNNKCIFYIKGKKCSNLSAPIPNKSNCLGIKNCDVYRLKDENETLSNK
jgi:hypothetical protein